MHNFPWNLSVSRDIILVHGVCFGDADKDAATWKSCLWIVYFLNFLSTFILNFGYSWITYLSFMNRTD
jgi:hypothetical protein